MRTMTRRERFLTALRLQTPDRVPMFDFLFQQPMYEMLIGGVASLLENRSQQEVATRADISGPVGNPETSTWQIIAELIKNAFFKAILPSFEKEATGAGKR